MVVDSVRKLLKIHWWCEGKGVWVESFLIWKWDEWVAKLIADVRQGRVQWNSSK